MYSFKYLLKCIDHVKQEKCESHEDRLSLLEMFIFFSMQLIVIESHKNRRAAMRFNKPPSMYKLFFATLHCALKADLHAVLH
jgi:hypothetical protein